MRVYNIAYSDPRGDVPLIVAPISEVIRCMKNWDAGLVNSDYHGEPPLKDAAEQARIILFAREMGWL